MFSFRQKSRNFVAIFVETRFPSSTKNADVTRGGIRCPNAKVVSIYDSLPSALDEIGDAQGENRFIESMCQTILSVDELLWIINHPDIDCNFKKPFLRYFLWVYMKTAGSAVESGAGDLPHDGSDGLFASRC